MSKQYDSYLLKHKENVTKAYRWMEENLPEIITQGANLEWQIVFGHDNSKTKSDEYEAYDEYFYGNNRSYAVKQAFDVAWLLHIHRNPHHWQHWVLINDDPKAGTVCLEMPYGYVIEMICDWWSFSWNSGNLNEIFKWYDEHKNYIKLHPNTRCLVEDILNQIYKKLEKSRI